MTVLGKVRRGGVTFAARSLALLATLSVVPRAARAQETPPPSGNGAPSVVTPGPAPTNDAPPAPPTAQPAPAPPGQPGSPPPGQAYPPGYAPPGYAPGYAPPGYAPGYAPPGYPPGYAPPGYAPPAYLSMPQEPTHGGLYLRLHLGGGFTSISGSDGAGNTTKFSGGGVSLGVAIGGAVAPNLAIFGAFFATVVTDPDVKVTGYGFSNVGVGTAYGDIGIGGFGAGVVYYFQPVNIYLSGVIAAMNVQADDRNGDSVYTSKYGPGFQGMIGKEWWVSQHWGLGVAGEFIASTMKDKTVSTSTWNGASFNVLFSATCF